MPRTVAVDGVTDIDTMVVGCPQLSTNTNIPSKHTNPAFFITRHILLDPKSGTTIKKPWHCNSAEFVILKKLTVFEVTGSKRPAAKWHPDTGSISATDAQPGATKEQFVKHPVPPGTDLGIQQSEDSLKNSFCEIEFELISNLGARLPNCSDRKFQDPGSFPEHTGNAERSYGLTYT
jgi:hypothetical protein